MDGSRLLVDTNIVLYALKGDKALVELIDGQDLSLLMIRYGLGVTVKQNYEVKEFDRDFFDET